MSGFGSGRDGQAWLGYGLCVVVTSPTSTFAMLTSLGGPSGGRLAMFNRLHIKLSRHAVLLLDSRALERWSLIGQTRDFSEREGGQVSACHLF